jgi:hypothetical protein
MDPDPDPDPPQNVMDPQHWSIWYIVLPLMKEAAVKHVEAASRLLRPPQLTEDAEEEDIREAPVWGEKISHLRHIEDRRKAKAYPRYAYVPQRYTV